jgi:hypothetical protein
LPTLLPLILIATLAIAGQPASPPAHTAPSDIASPLASDDPPCPQKRTGTTEGKFRDYAIRVYRSPEFESCLQITQHGNVVYTLESHDFRIGANMSGDGTIPLGTDITGTGQPDAVIVAWSGGAHCCTSLYILELGAQFREVQKIELENSDLPNFTRPKPGSPYQLTTADWAFQYWRTSFAESPAPKVVLKFRDGQFRIAFDAMQTPAPSDQKFAAMLREVKSDSAWHASAAANCGLDCGVPVVLWRDMLTLLYSGHSDLAWKLFDQSWPPARKGKSDFAAAFCKQLATSHYWSDLQTDIGPCPRRSDANYTPTTLLRRSSSVTLRQTPFMQPTRSRMPSTRKPAFACIRMLAAFSGNIPACSVQIPAASDPRINSANNFGPTPRPRALAATYTLTSATPRYTCRFDTGLSAAQPAIAPPDFATNRDDGKCAVSQSTHSDAAVSNVAFPVAIPSR